MNSNQAPKKANALSSFIFASRWLQLPLYVGLILAQAVYVFHFWVELVHLIEAAFGNQDALKLIFQASGQKAEVAPTHLTETTIMLVVLGLIDVVMISNLLIMVIIGGYETFVSRLNLEGHSLVHRALRQHPRQALRVHHLDSVPVREVVALDLLGPIRRRQQPARAAALRPRLLPGRPGLGRPSLSVLRALGRLGLRLGLRLERLHLLEAPRKRLHLLLGHVVDAVDDALAATLRERWRLSPPLLLLLRLLLGLVPPRRVAVPMPPAVGDEEVAHEPEGREGAHAAALTQRAATVGPRRASLSREIGRGAHDGAPNRRESI